ncbi:hypothetical protein HMPREF9005_2478, partial [Actinomyces sp. oral taxon 178 str. F0338]
MPSVDHLGVEATPRRPRGQAGPLRQSPPRPRYSPSPAGTGPPRGPGRSARR